MTFDRDDFTARVVERRADLEGRELIPMLRVIEGARPVSMALVRDDNWRRYLEILQGLMAHAEESRARAIAALTGPSNWEAPILAKLKSDVLCAEGMIAAWKIAIELPASIIDGGGRAAEIIKRFEAEHAVTGQAEPQTA